MRLGLVALCLVVVLLPLEGRAEKNLVVYLPDYRCKVDTDFQFYGATHLVLFSAQPNDDGVVDFSRITPELLAAGKLAKQQNRKVLVCVGGWVRSRQFANAVSRPESRKRMVDSLFDFCETHHLDGVDIDWEFPRGEVELQNFDRFLRALSDRMRVRQKLITVAISASHPLLPSSYDYIDQVNLMSYQPWHPAPYAKWLEDSVAKAIRSGVEPGKLNVGLPFYTKEMGGERRAISWRKLVGPSAVAIPQTGNEFSPVGLGICDLRVELVAKLGLAGVMIWEYGHNSSLAEHSLLKYTSEALAKMAANKADAALR